MGNNFLSLALIFLSTSIVLGFDAKILCGDDWLVYGDEKCIRLFRRFETPTDAEEIFFNSSDSNSVWIGAERVADSATEFVWNDGSRVERYTNWEINRPSTEPRNTCVQMRSAWSRNFYGLQWLDTTCTRGEWFICQKVQAWPVDYLQQAILSARRELEYNVNSFKDQMTETTNRLNNAEKELKYLHDNPIPINFVYVQLPDEPEPWRLWLSVEWTEITDHYAGLFFRAVGGGSAQFGTVQAENSPRLQSVTGALSTTSLSSCVVPISGGTSTTVSAGATGGTLHWGLRFSVSSGEIRPRNTAVRIWMRTK